MGATPKNPKQSSTNPSQKKQSSLAVPCATCWAGADSVCRNGAGRPARPHLARLRAAGRAAPAAGAVRAPRNRSGHDLTERSGAEPASQELPLAPRVDPEEFRAKKAPEKPPRPAAETVPWGARVKLFEVLAQLEAGQLTKARALLLEVVDKPANLKPANTLYQAMERGAAPQAGSAQLAKVLEEVASRVRLAQQGLRDVDGKRLPKAAQDKLTTVRGGTLPSLLEYVEAQAAQAGVELEPGEAAEAPEEAPEDDGGEGDCGAPHVVKNRLALCTKPRGHAMNHGAGDAEWTEVDSEHWRRQFPNTLGRPPREEAAAGGDPGSEPKEDEDATAATCTAEDCRRPAGPQSDFCAGHAQMAAQVAAAKKATDADNARLAREHKAQRSAKSAAPEEEPAEHTPGPWEVARPKAPSGEASQYERVQVVDSTGAVLTTANVLKADKEAVASAVKDGELMAAAPDMKEVLQGMLALLERAKERPLTPEQCEGAMEDIRGVLKQAGVARG
jgi:hypothetical protein